MLTSGLVIYLLLAVYLFALGYVEFRSDKATSHRRPGKIRQRYYSARRFGSTLVYCFIWWLPSY